MVDECEAPARADSRSAMPPSAAPMTSCPSAMSLSAKAVSFLPFEPSLSPPRFFELRAGAGAGASAGALYAPLPMPPPMPPPMLPPEPMPPMPLPEPMPLEPMPPMPPPSPMRSRARLCTARSFSTRLRYSRCSASFDLRIIRATFSSCESISMYVRICWILTSSRYPRATISSNAKISSKAVSVTSSAVSDGQQSDTTRVKRRSVSRSSRMFEFFVVISTM
mmetsp:Transcript_18277/g.47773  ORF Transcript_18277/g.47773 Transcript_18277/m.47773 type:complete len:222 (+) Transcript_18277:2465-3130(+)